jgi:hypothetical protein
MEVHVMKHPLLMLVLMILSCASVATGQVGLTVGTEYGIGLTAQLGPHATKLELGGGILPYFFFATVTFGDDITKLFFPGTIGAKLSFSTKKSAEENRVGIKLGASYNTLLKAGFGGGVDFQAAENPKIVISGGAMIYPKAKEEIVRKINEDDGTNYAKDDFSAPLASFQPFVNISIFFGKPSQTSK